MDNVKCLDTALIAHETLFEQSPAVGNFITPVLQATHDLCSAPTPCCSGSFEGPWMCAGWLAACTCTAQTTARGIAPSRLYSLVWMYCSCPTCGRLVHTSGRWWCKQTGRTLQTSAAPANQNTRKCWSWCFKQVAQEPVRKIWLDPRPKAHAAPIGIWSVES